LARDYAEYAWHFRVLADAQREGRLVFVLGAGVSKIYGLPTWKDLLVNLLLGSERLPRLARTEAGAARDDPTRMTERSVLKEILDGIAPDPLLQAAIARAAYSRGQWSAAIKAHVKADGNGALRERERHASASGTRQQKPALEVIAHLLVTAIVKNPHRHLSVLTFNYDSLLEEEVRRQLDRHRASRSLLQSVSDARRFERTWVDAGIFIYHLHGHLTADSRQQPESDAVLDADSYVAVLRGDHWSWRCMERALTASGATSLFIGLSIADPSLRYLLTRWGEWQTPLMGVYLASPPEHLRTSEELSAADRRTVALMQRTVMDLYTTVLDRLHLVCYQLSSFDEIPDILEGLEGTEPS
jgi:hypothetical protein